MNSGDYKHKIDFYTRDQNGNETFYKSKWAAFKTLSTRQMLNAKALDIVITHEVRIRYCTDIKKNMIFKKGNRTFTIQSIKDYDEKHEELVLTCNEVL